MRDQVLAGVTFEVETSQRALIEAAEQEAPGRLRLDFVDALEGVAPALLELYKQNRLRQLDLTESGDEHFSKIRFHVTVEVSEC